MEEGKTTVAKILADRFTDDGFRVLLIDADLRRPRLAKMLKLMPAFFLESVLSGAATSEQAIVSVRSGLDCLCASGNSENPVKVFSSDRFAQLLITSRQEYDFVILDSPPVLHVADPIILAKLCQYILFIVQAGRLSRELVGEATRRFAEEDRPRMFTLLTRVRRNDLDKRDYYSGY
jgi:succinoglycan biosynthesis transport protein ExoP